MNEIAEYSSKEKKVLIIIICHKFEYHNSAVLGPMQHKGSQSIEMQKKHTRSVNEFVPEILRFAVNVKLRVYASFFLFSLIWCLLLLCFDFRTYN